MEAIDAILISSPPPKLYKHQKDIIFHGASSLRKNNTSGNLRRYDVAQYSEGTTIRKKEIRRRVLGLLSSNEQESLCVFSSQVEEREKMAESVILPLIQKLGLLLIDEAHYLLQVKPEIESLQTQLKMMTAYLKEADAIHHKSVLVQEWVSQLRELAFQAEDAIDIFVYEVAQKQQDSVVGKIKKFPKLLFTAHNLRMKIQDIQEKMKILSDNRMSYEIQPLKEDQTSAQAHEGEASGVQNFRPVDVVGFQSEAEELAKLLMKEEPLGRIGVVSITGMGGLGKTTLAQKIYNRNDVKRHFDCQACVRISKELRKRDVLYDIIKQVVLLTEKEKNSLASEEARILEERLSDFLKEKKSYLFLLDDVWLSRDWDELKRSFPIPRDNQKCRVLLTTRDDSVARHADPIAPPHKLQLLDEEKSLKLFLKVFFRCQDDVDAEGYLNSLNEEMKDLAVDMVKKCDGLPLAIVVLAGLLSDKRLNNVAEWKKVVDNVNWHLETSDCQKVLALSYTQLPSHLKSCFLYFGCFPEDTRIGRDRLIRLWVAEGFLEPRENSTMEDVAGEYLEELMKRNLIQVGKWKSNGEPQSFFIHDLLLNLAILEAKKGNFLNISTLDQDQDRESLKCSRRLALHRDNHSENTVADSSFHHSSSLSSTTNLVRSFFCFTELPSLSLYGQFKLLNVLDLEGAPSLESLPNEIGKLIFLKYLSVRCCGLKTLSPWIANLYNLQTLDLSYTFLESVPIEVFGLEKLRHLLCLSAKGMLDDSSTADQSGICGVCRRRRRPRIDQLRGLQTLWLNTGSWMEDGLETLTNLRELGLKGSGEVLMDKYKEALLRTLDKLERLEVLYLDEQILGRTVLLPFAGHRYLYDVTLKGAIEKLPDLNNFPPHLTRLELAYSNLKEDMMEILEKLPELKELSLGWNPYDGAVIKCSVGGFPKLECLTLIYFCWLRYWIVEEGAMPNLKTLEINSLYGLKWIPGGLKHITTLQTLTLSMPKEFLERVKEGGEDWEKIKHVLSINTREEQIPEDISRDLPEYERTWFASTKQRIPDDDN